jgi:hypothetical protein
MHPDVHAEFLSTIVAAGKNTGPGRASRISTLKFEMLFGENAVAEHEPGTRLDGMLRQEPSRKLGGGLPHTRIQPRIETGELWPESH